MTATSIEDLSSILVPSIFYAIVKNRLPWPRDKSLAFEAVTTYIFRNEPDDVEEFHRI
jgi:hypothetical protein